MVKTSKKRQVPDALKTNRRLRVRLSLKAKNPTQTIGKQKPVNLMRAIVEMKSTVRMRTTNRMAPTSLL
jgi:hypothetical protein